uniref:Uncharacterized protein n=1 Tax=Trichuris muris TaxID=70415 RepID=A0A5S6R145_TRIMR
MNADANQQYRLESQRRRLVETGLAGMDRENLVSRSLPAGSILVEIGSAEPWLVCAYANEYRKDYSLVVGCSYSRCH